MTLGVTDRTVDLVAEGVDCVLRIGELPDSSLVARRIGMATMVTCAAPEYIREFGVPDTLEDLKAHRGISFLSGQNQRPPPLAIFAGWHRQQLHQSPRYRCQ